MLVNYKKDNLKTFKLTDVKTDYPHMDEVITLMPGINDVDDELWSELKRIYLLDRDKNLEEVQKQVIDEDGKKKKSSNFVDFDNELQREMIEDCYNIKVLEKWRLSKVETDIRVIIDDKIKSIKDAKFDKSIGSSQINMV